MKRIFFSFSFHASFFITILPQCLYLSHSLSFFFVFFCFFCKTDTFLNGRYLKEKNILKTAKSEIFKLKQFVWQKSRCFPFFYSYHFFQLVFCFEFLNLF